MGKLFAKRFLWIILFVSILSIGVFTFIPLLAVFLTVVPLFYWIFTRKNFFTKNVSDFINNPEYDSVPAPLIFNYPFCYVLDKISPLIEW